MEQALETFTAAFYFHSNHKDIEVQVSLNEAIDLVCENVFLRRIDFSTYMHAKNSTCYGM